jgi:hypothetical protein
MPGPRCAGDRGGEAETASVRAVGYRSERLARCGGRRRFPRAGVGPLRPPQILRSGLATPSGQRRPFSPLPCGTRMSAVAPNGDSGGNKVTLDCNLCELPAFWDAALGRRARTSKSSGAMIRFAKALQALDALAAANPDAGSSVAESLAAAESTVYHSRPLESFQLRREQVSEPAPARATCFLTRVLERAGSGGPGKGAFPGPTGGVIHQRMTSTVGRSRSWLRPSSPPSSSRLETSPSASSRLGRWRLVPQH